MIYEKQPRTASSKEIDEQKDLEEFLKNLPQILQELEKELTQKENTTDNCR